MADTAHKFPTPPVETAETRDNNMYAPPSAPPKEWASYMKNGLDCKIYETYTANKVPYMVIKGLVDDDWGDLAALVHRRMPVAAPPRPNTTIQIPPQKTRKWGGV